MEIYFNEIFSIKRPFNYNRLTAKAFYQGMQIQETCISKFDDYALSKLTKDTYVKGVVMEVSSPEVVEYLFQLVSSYFIARSESTSNI